MARKHEIAIAAETGAFEKGVKSGVVEPLEDAEKALKDLGDVSVGRDIDKDLQVAQRATKELKSETKEAADAIEQAFRQSYKKVKDDSDDATKKMKGGFQEAKEEASSSGREAAASFGGGFDDVADFVQETLANALGGFGPIGAAAGIALAAVIGTALSQAEAAQQKLNDAREAAADLASQMYENGGTLPLQERVEELFTILSREAKPNGQLQSMVDQWTDFGTVLEDLKHTAEQTGRPASELLDALTGSDLEGAREILARVNEELDGMSEWTPVWDEQRQSLEGYRTELETAIATSEQAAEINQMVSESGAAAAAARAQAEEEAADRIKAASDSVVEEQLGGYDRMRTAAYEKATADDAAFDVGKWLTYVEESRVAADTYRENLQTMQLTPGEWENLLALPEEARGAIVQSYASSGEEGKSRIREALGDGGAGEAGQEATVSFSESFNPEADVEVTADTSGAEKKLVEVAKKRQAMIDVATSGVVDAYRVLDGLSEERSVTLKVKVDASAWDRYTPATKTGTVRTRLQYTDQ